MCGFINYSSWNLQKNAFVVQKIRVIRWLDISHANTFVKSNKNEIFFFIFAFQWHASWLPIFCVYCNYKLNYNCNYKYFTNIFQLFWVQSLWPCPFHSFFFFNTVTNFLSTCFFPTFFATMFILIWFYISKRNRAVETYYFFCTAINVDKSFYHCFSRTVFNRWQKGELPAMVVSDLISGEMMVHTILIVFFLL